jgi:hypothetical protein
VEKARVVPKKLFDSPPLLEDVTQGDVLNLAGNGLARKIGNIDIHTPLRLYSCGFALSSAKRGERVTVVPWDNSIIWEVQKDKGSI